ncbi:hypothetical protein [Xanthobacter autotrophicus]|uniref:hypothetical protein n=1 Tax=Xanthobacter autotrophicus TaxID=280 RepID=UPI003726AECF
MSFFMAQVPFVEAIRICRMGEAPSAAVRVEEVMRHDETTMVVAPGRSIRLLHVNPLAAIVHQLDPSGGEEDVAIIRLRAERAGADAAMIAIKWSDHLCR